MATVSQTKPKPNKTFEGLRCVHCGCEDGLDIRVESLAIECRECGEAITRDQVQVIVRRWGRLFDWLDSAGE